MYMYFCTTLCCKLISLNKFEMNSIFCSNNPSIFKFNWYLKKQQEMRYYIN